MPELVVEAERGATPSHARRSAILPLEAVGIGVTRNGRALVEDVGVVLDGHGVTVLMGPNGAGKSLLLRVLAGLLPPDRGTVRWAGRAPDRKRAPKLGFVFQKPVLLRRSAVSNVRYALRAMGLPRNDCARRAREALEWASLEHLARAPARVLSGGEQQRLAIARAFATAPEVMFLDEPTSSLDPTSTAAIEALIDKARSQGTKLVVVTHDVGQARRLADEVLFIHRGRVTERALADRFFDAPESEPARAFIEGRIVI